MQGRKMNCTGNFADRYSARSNKHGDAGPIDPQARNAANRHSNIGEREEGADKRMSPMPFPSFEFCRIDSVLGSNAVSSATLLGPFKIPRRDHETKTLASISASPIKRPLPVLRTPTTPVLPILR
jgi:hypothetical protein